MEAALREDRRRVATRQPAVGLALLLLLATVLRVLRLDYQPLWWDEGYSVWFATHPLGQMAALTAADIHPPLYYALLRGWTLLLGAGPVALRLLSVVFGTLGIPAIYLAGRRLFGKGRAPLLAAFLLAINPLHVFYSQEVRMYGLVALLSVGVIAAAWRIFDTETQRYGDAAQTDPPGAPGPGLKPRPDTDESRLKPADMRVTNPVHRVSTCSARRFNAGREGWSALVAYVLFATLALYTQYYAAFLPVGLTLYALWHWRRDVRALARWLAAQAAVALLYLPWALYAAPKLAPYVSQKIVADADKPLGLIIYAARHLAAFSAGHLEGPLAGWWPAALILLLPIIISLRLLLARSRPTGDTRHAPRATQSAIRNPQSAIPLLASILLAALLLGWLISLRAPFFPERGERLLILALPAFILLAAAGLDALWIRWRAVSYVTLGLVVATSVASLTAFYTVPRYRDNDYRPLIARVTEQGLPEDTVFAIYPWQVGYWRSYGSAAGPAALLAPIREGDDQVTAALDAALDRGRVWFPAHLALGAILEKQIEAHLVGRATTFLNEWHGPNTRLSAWAAAPDPPPLPTDSARFTIPGGGSVTLAGVNAWPDPVPAANAVTPLALHWQASAPPPSLAVSVRLTDGLGQIWAQHDYEPLGGLGTSIAQNDRDGWRATDRLGLLIPAGTPPGRYRVELVVRPKGGDRAADVQAPDGRVLGQSARLFGLDVATADRPLGPERLPIATRRPLALGGGLRFLGFSTAQAPLATGELRKVSLFWQAAAQPAMDASAFVQVLGRDGTPVALWEAPPGAAYPTSAWAPGTLMRTQASFRVPASVPDGRYRLIAGLFRADDKARLRTTTGADHISLGTITVRSRPHQMAAPQPGQPADVVFGATARLVGYDLAVTEAQPGGALTLTLHWQALAATDRPYTVFVHLTDAAGAVRGYGDAEPGGGAFPTPGWLAGEYLADTHTVIVAPDAAPGTYRLAVGLYDPATGERLKTSDGADQVTLPMAVQVH